MTFPPAEKHLSEEADVVGTQNISLDRDARCGILSRLVFQ
jgi:hypothetical protein